MGDGGGEVVQGGVTNVLCAGVPDTKRGTPGPDGVTVKGTITGLGVHAALAAGFRLDDRLFTEAQPVAGGRDFKSSLNPHSKKVVNGSLKSVYSWTWGYRAAKAST